MGPHGVRVCGIWTAGVAETLSDEKIEGVGGDGAPTAQTAMEMIAGMSALRRTPTLADVAEVAAFLASDRGGHDRGDDERDCRARSQIDIRTQPTTRRRRKWWI